MHPLNVYSIRYAYGIEDMAREQWHEMMLFTQADHRINLFTKGPYVIIGMKLHVFAKLGTNDNNLRIQEHDRFNFVLQSGEPDDKIKLRAAVTKSKSDNLDQAASKTNAR